MKISITPSNDQSKEKHPHFAVSIEHPSDDLDAAQLVSMFRQLMLSFGYSESTVDEYLGEE